MKPEPNDPTQWRAQHPTSGSHLHPTYPRDGRETIYEPYEQAARTDSVGAYREAQQKVADRDPSLPHDYDAYLAQRIPSSHHLSDVPQDTPIDRRGRV